MGRAVGAVVATLVLACGQPAMPTASSPTGTAGAVPTAAVARGSPIPATGPPSTVNPTSFHSPRYGYDATIFGGWSTAAAFVRWDGAGSPGHDAAEVDKFFGPGELLIFAFAAPTTDALGAYLDHALAAAAAIHGACPVESTAAVTIGVEDGREAKQGCGLLIDIAVTVHAGVGYQFVMRDPAVQVASDPQHDAVFAGFLASVRLPD